MINQGTLRLTAVILNDIETVRAARAALRFRRSIINAGGLLYEMTCPAIYRQVSEACGDALDAALRAAGVEMTGRPGRRIAAASWPVGRNKGGIAGVD